MIAGASQYACSVGYPGNWVNTYPFKDPAAAGSIVSRVDVTLLGSYACNITASVVQVTLNGYPINVLQNYGSNACACNSCDGKWVFSAQYPTISIPGYQYGGSNAVTLQDLSGSVCLNSVNITVYWAPARM
jgi:hypothetical protein